MTTTTTADSQPEPESQPATSRSRTDRLYRMLASTIDARRTCFARNTADSDVWMERHTYAIGQLATECLPSGAGVDSGTTVDLELSHGERIVLHTAFHHMDDGGGYDGWTEHIVTVTASLIHGITLKISGPNRNDIKDYLYDVFSNALRRQVTETYEPATDSVSYRVEYNAT